MHVGLFQYLGVFINWLEEKDLRWVGRAGGQQQVYICLFCLCFLSFVLCLSVVSSVVVGRVLYWVVYQGGGVGRGVGRKSE